SATNLISLYSSPGYFCAMDWLAGRTEPWDVHSPTLEGEDDVAYTLRVMPEDGLFLLIWTCPRARLDAVRFREELDRFVAICRFWGSVLSPTPEEREEPVESGALPALLQRW